MEKQKKIRWWYKSENGKSGKMKGNKTEIERKFTLYQWRTYVVKWMWIIVSYAIENSEKQLLDEAERRKWWKIK